MQHNYFTLRLVSLIFLSGLFLLNNSCKSGKKSQEGKEVGIEDFLNGGGYF